MHKIGSAALVGVALTIGFNPPPSSALDLSQGPAEVTLGICAQGSGQSDTFVPDCSYVYLSKKAAPSYTYLTSQGAVSWQGGSLSGGTLSFPAAGQTWPVLTNLYLGATSTLTPRDITGSIDTAGRVELTMGYDLTLAVGSAQCTLSGTVKLSSQATETLGGQATGANYDPGSGRFAVVSTGYSAPAQTGDCLLTNAAYDLSQGVGWYLTGTMTLPGAAKPQTAKPQTAKVKLPKAIKANGTTVLLRKTLRTNAGQPVWTTPTWSTNRKAAGKNAKYASANVTRSGKLTITTTGKAKKLYVKLVLHAPAVEGYQPYRLVKKWTVKR